MLRSDVYRAGGGIPRDSEYGYSRDFRCPPVGHFQLNAPAGKTASRQADDVTDLALLRRKFRVRARSYVDSATFSLFIYVLLTLQYPH